MEIIAAVVIFGLVIAGMSVGYIFMNKPIAGSCGGLNNLDGEGKDCSICGRAAEGKCSKQVKA